MSKGPKLMNYVSDTDKFLQNFDNSHPVLSKSQIKELNKYRRIYELRDAHEEVKNKSENLWD